MQENAEPSLPELLMSAMKAGIIDRYCVDPTDVRFWQGNLRLQFEHEEAIAFLTQLLGGFHSAGALSDASTDENW